MQCGVLSLSYKEKKKLSGTKVCNLQTLRYCPVTSLYDITRVPSACFSRARGGGLASAETMHRIGLLNKNLITVTSSKRQLKVERF